MFVEERLDSIVENIKKNGKVLVKDLSEEFNISEDMVRKDLKRLEKKGIVKRTYGGAILERKIVGNENTTSRIISNIKEKDMISEVVVDKLEDGDIIFLDISSTNYSIAERLVNLQKSITIITNMNRIPLLLTNNHNIDIICIGGKYNKKLGGTIGGNANEEIKKYRITKAFIGVGGLNLDGNYVTNFNIEEASTKRAIIESSKETYLVASNEKFYLDGSYKFATFEDVEYIITDAVPEEKFLKKLSEYGVKVLNNSATL